MQIIRAEWGQGVKNQNCFSTSHMEAPKDRQKWQFYGKSGLSPTNKVERVSAGASRIGRLGMDGDR